MKKTDFTGMCELVGEGRLTWLENTRSHEKGRVLSCTENRIEVEVAGKREEWIPRECRELTHGYKIDYEEVVKDPEGFESRLS